MAGVPHMQAPAPLVEETLQEALDLSRQLQQALCDQPSCMLSQSIQTAESFGAIAILLQSFRDSHSRGYGTVVWGEQCLSSTYYTDTARFPGTSWQSCGTDSWQLLILNLKGCVESVRTLPIAFLPHLLANVILDCRTVQSHLQVASTCITAILNVCVYCISGLFKDGNGS